MVNVSNMCNTKNSITLFITFESLLNKQQQFSITENIPLIINGGGWGYLW